MEILSLGDSALIVRLLPQFETDPSAAFRAVRGAMRKLTAAKIPQILECAPAYDSVALYLDIDRLSTSGETFADTLARLKQRIAIVLETASDEEEVPSPEIEIPVCYAAAFGLDLAEVARHSGLTSSEVVRRHTTAHYRVQCVGFTPGFPYLAGLPEELSTPRRATPRKEVPAGSVAIGGGQTGIYPSASPGGWNIIGRTPLHLFDPMREPAALLRIGMSVCFREITREEFDASSL